MSDDHANADSPPLRPTPTPTPTPPPTPTADPKCNAAVLGRLQGLLCRLAKVRRLGRGSKGTQVRPNDFRDLQALANF